MAAACAAWAAAAVAALAVWEVAELEEEPFCAEEPELDPPPIRFRAGAEPPRQKIRPRATGHVRQAGALRQFERGKKGCMGGTAAEITSTNSAAAHYNPLGM